MREWLTVIIVLLIIAIVLDGLRRVRAHRRETLRLSKNMLEVDALLKDEVAPSSEFPSGGARVIAYREPDDTENILQNVRESYAASRMTRGAKRAADEDGGDLETPVPLMGDAGSFAQTPSDGHTRWDDREPESDPFPEAHAEPSLGNLDELDWQEDRPVPAQPTEQEQTEPPAKASSARDYNSDGRQQRSAYDDTHWPDDRAQEDDWAHETAEARPDAQRETRVQAPTAKRAPESPPEPDTSQAPAAPDEVLVINVMARRGEMFLGDALLASMISCGLRYGEMDIFHRFETPDGKGKVLFSLANMVKPGTFELDAMDTFETPGVCLFLALPTGGDSLRAFELMAETAQTLARDLGAELKDEQRSVMTRQTIEHSRQRVVEYERKRRLAKA